MQQLCRESASKLRYQIGPLPLSVQSATFLPVFEEVIPRMRLFLSHPLPGVNFSIPSWEGNELAKMSKLSSLNPIANPRNSGRSPEPDFVLAGRINVAIEAGDGSESRAY